MKNYQLDIFGNLISTKEIVLTEKLDKKFYIKLRKEVAKNVSKKVKR